ERDDTTRTDIRVTKFKPDGTIDWEKIYDISARDRCFHISNARDGYILTGMVLEGFWESVLVIQIDNDGGIVKSKVYDQTSNNVLNEVNWGLSIIQPSPDSGEEGFRLVGFGMGGNVFPTHRNEVK